MAEDKNELFPSFEGKKIRRIEHNGQWYFSIIDIIEVLTESPQPSRYWTELKKKLTKEEDFSQLFDKIERLKLISSDGKKYATDTANTETLLRIIQSIPSKKAEPLKRWLAKVGFERLEEIQNPELSMERMKAIYEQKGYSKEWIEKRTRGIAVRQELTDEWKERGAKEGKESAILTDEINKATFGVKTKEHKEIKDLSQKDNLRDHMVDLELILTMLGEATAIKIHKEKDSQGFYQLKHDAKDAGDIAGNARKQIEAKTGQPVVSEEHYKHLTSKKYKRLEGDTENERYKRK